MLPCLLLLTIRFFRYLLFYTLSSLPLRVASCASNNHQPITNPNATNINDPTLYSFSSRGISRCTATGNSQHVVLAVCH